MGPLSRPEFKQRLNSHHPVVLLPAVAAILPLDEGKGAAFSSSPLWFGLVRDSWSIYLFEMWKPALGTIITGKDCVGSEDGSVEGKEKFSKSLSSAVPTHISHPCSSPPQGSHMVCLKWISSWWIVILRLKQNLSESKPKEYLCLLRVF